MSTSIVTRSGSSAWILRSASRPFRAVPATRNSPELSSICVIRRRIKALSSTTRTDRGPPVVPVPNGAALEDTVALLQRSDFDASVVEKEVHASSVVAPDVLGDDWDIHLAQRLSRRSNVAVADGDAASRDQIREHACAADELRANAALIGAEASHLGKQEGHGGRGEFRRVGMLARHRLIGQERVRETPHPCRPVVQRDRDTGPKADRNQRLIITTDRAVGDLDPNLGRGAGFDHARRKMRSRASIAAKRDRTGPRSVSTLPSTRKPPGASAS